MTDAERLAKVEFVGIQHGPVRKGLELRLIPLFTDPLTGTTFSLQPGETLGRALIVVDARMAVPNNGKAE